MKLYHQCGHCSVWNRDSLVDDSCGDGLIFSPVHEKRERLEAYDPDVRRRSFFDPQFYLPNSQKAKLQTYDFFPEVVSSGFSTIDYNSVASKAAKLCIAFQVQQEYDRIIIPSRYFNQMDPDFTQKQEAYTVVPFLNEISKHTIVKPIYLTLPLTSHMIESVSYRTKILNWVTSFPEISGVYLIADHERQSKQISSKPFLLEMLKLNTELIAADLKVIIGYSNTESILYSVVGDVDLTFGAYENTRIFTIDKFVDSDEDRRGPRARIYLDGLLNWVQFAQADTIKNDDPAIWAKIYKKTSYAEKVFTQAVEPHFNQPDLYKHFFLRFSKQIDKLKPLSRIERYKLLKDWIKAAISLNEEIENMPMDLEKHGSGMHLQSWLDALNSYYSSHLKTSA